ncbi:MAG: hypothetical protein QM750_28370 [Rubrivivax sp.]
MNADSRQQRPTAARDEWPTQRAQGSADGCGALIERLLAAVDGQPDGVLTDADRMAAYPQYQRIKQALDPLDIMRTAEASTNGESIGR